jgi:hypothetical protein
MSNKEFQWSDSLAIEYSNTLFAFGMNNEAKIKQFKDSILSRQDWKEQLSNNTKPSGIFKE